MDAVCYGATAPAKLLPGCSNNVPMCDCECTRVTTKLCEFDPDIPSVVWTHKSCVCNERAALLLRHQIDTGAQYTSKLNLRKALKPYVKRIRPVSYDCVIQRATPRKRKLLIQARESLLLKDLCEQDARVAMFLKDDKDHFWRHSVPRCIQYRSKRYCLPLASYLTPIEHYMCTMKDDSDTPIFAKSRNLNQRGDDIAAKMSMFHDPVVISLDHSKFDAHVNMQLLDIEHWFYKSCCRSPELKRLLHWQRVNKGRTKNGTKYVTRATRMSGDQNTGIGNSIINFAMTKALFGHMKICYYIDGDDYLIFVERSEASKINPDSYLQFGMETKLESVTSVIEHIDFCQTRPVFNGVGYTMCRNPERMLKRVQWGVGKFSTAYIPKYLSSVGKCLIAIGRGLPVEQYIGRTLSVLSNTYVVTSYHYSANRMPFRPGRASVVEPGVATRLSYEMAWGISAQKQLLLENSSVKTNFKFVEGNIPLPHYDSQEQQVTETEWS